MKTFFLALLLLFFTDLFSQQTDNQYLIDKDIIRNIKSENLVPRQTRFTENKHIPFTKITVRDFRFDTTQFGMMYYMKESKGWSEKINFEGGMANAINSYLDNYFKNNFSGSSGELFCSINYMQFFTHDTTRSQKALNKSWKYLRAAFSCYYMVNNKYYRAFMMDTTIIRKINKRKSGTLSISTDMINILAGKIANIDSVSLIQTQSYSWELISLVLNNRFNIPILTTAQPAKGIFQTFGQFKKNDPGIKDFTYTIAPTHTITFFDAQKQVLNLQNPFAFSDGTTSWIIIEKRAFPLIKTGNTFEYVWRPVEFEKKCYVQSINFFFGIMPTQENKHSSSDF